MKNVECPSEHGVVTQCVVSLLDDGKDVPSPSATLREKVLSEAPHAYAACILSLLIVLVVGAPCGTDLCGGTAAKDIVQGYISSRRSASIGSLV